MNQEEIQKMAMEFERNRAQLMGLSQQKQQLQLQARAIGESLGALKETKEKKVYKAVGNILIFSDVAKVKKELTDQKESTELRVKTMQKQEDAMVDKLNKLRADLEKAAGEHSHPHEHKEDGEGSK